MTEQLASGHRQEGNPRCEACIERATSRVRQELEAIYASGGDPDAMTVLVQFNEHLSHEVFFVPLLWECHAIAAGDEDIRDEVNDRFHQHCAEALRPAMAEHVSRYKVELEMPDSEDADSLVRWLQDHHGPGGG